MFTKFKLFERQISINIENNKNELIKDLIDKFSFIIYKQIRKPINLRIKNINGYFNKTDFKNTNLIYKTELYVELSNLDIIYGVICTHKEYSNIKIKINDKLIYDMNNKNFDNESLIDKMISLYKNHIRKNYKIK